jgi:3-isopropylmalate dehydrogenase
MTRIVLLPGDGIGPEVVAQARLCLEMLSDQCGLGLEFEARDFGGIAIERHGTPLPEATLAACRNADAVLLGAVGGPQWEGAAERPESGLLQLRAELGLFANLRPARVVRGLSHLSPLRPDLVDGADILVVRELTGGAYFGEKRLEDDLASDACVYSRAEIERIAHVAFAAARRRGRRVTSVDKANVLATSKLWRRVVAEVALDYPDVTLEHVLVDAAAMMLVTAPRRFDVILTENLFGDILSDELAVIGGSIGILPSACVGSAPPALFEPIHGSAPDLAGLDVANPAGTIAAAAMLLGHLGHSDLESLLADAVETSLAEGCRTADLGGSDSCSEFGARVRERLTERIGARDAHLALIAMNRGCCG